MREPFRRAVIGENRNRRKWKLFSVVPTSTTMTGTATADARITQKSFMLAISTNNGKTWTFVDGSTLTPAMLSKLIPDLPPELKLPPPQAPMIQRTR
jgi:hypothetical protein